MMKNPICSEQPISSRRPIVHAVLSEPPMGIIAEKCSVFPGGVAISYSVRDAHESRGTAPEGNLDRIYMPKETGYVIGYKAGKFGRISFSCVRTGEYKTEQPTHEEIDRFRTDLAEAAKRDMAVGLFLDLNPQVMG